MYTIFSISLLREHDKSLSLISDRVYCVNAGCKTGEKFYCSRRTREKCVRTVVNKGAELFRVCENLFLVLFPSRACYEFASARSLITGWIYCAYKFLVDTGKRYASRRSNAVGERRRRTCDLRKVNDTREWMILI